MNTLNSVFIFVQFCFGKYVQKCDVLETPKKDGEESSFFDCWDEQSDVLQQADPWARNAPKSFSRAKGCTSVNVPAFSVSEVGCVQSTVANYSSPV